MSATTPNPSPCPAVVRHDGAVELGELVRGALAQLTALHTVLKQLAELAGTKLAAMRRADSAALQQCATQEEALLRILFRSEQARNAALAQLAPSLLIPPATPLQLTVIAEHLPEPLASALRARGRALQEVGTDLQLRNKLAAVVAQNMQAHLRVIFAAVAGATQESLVYVPQG